MKIETRAYKLKGLTRLLGSQPANPEVRSTYIASKAATTEKGDEETAMLPEDLQTRNLTVFLRDKGGIVSICDYVIKGFLKEAVTALKGQIALANGKSKIDNLVLIEPAYLHIWRDGEELDCADGDFERPLRAMTMQGPRVSVTASEYIDPEWEITFEVTLLENKETKKSEALTWTTIENLLDYGYIKGLGQWRNGQNGRFVWERVDES